MDYRTDAEKKLQDIIEDALGSLARGHMGVVGFQKLMGDLRTAKSMLVNKQFGCPSGKHSAVCECRWRRAA